MEKKITPDEYPVLTEQALAIGRIFIETLGTIPTSWREVLIKIPSLLSFFKLAKPHFEIIINEIKD